MTRAASAPQPRQAQQAFDAQLARGLGAALRKGTGEVSIRLRPEALGDLKVSLRVDGSTVDARITASTQQAHELLEQSVGTLRAALESRGLQAGRLEIQAAPETSGDPTGSEERESWAGGPDAERDARGRTRGARGSEMWGGGAARRTEGDEESAPDGTEALGGHEAPGVVYSVADGAARVLWVDALA